MSLHPFVEVTVNGNPARDTFYNLLVSVTIHDAPGQEADTIELRFDDGGNILAIPAKGAVVMVRFGFRDGGAQKMGVFIVEKISIEGGEGGEFLLISGRSADMRSDVKEPLSEHFDNSTVGSVVDELAKRHGYAAKVSPELKSIELPYLARYEQGTTDFLTRLADRFGALFAVKDQKFLFLTHGTLPPVAIDKSECESWSFEVEPRPLFGKTEAGWFDREKGEIKYEDHQTGLKGASKRLRRILPSQAEAKQAAKSEGNRLGRATGSGSITLAGRPDIMADAPINLSGFRSAVNGLWRCAGVDHVYQETYMTTIEVEAPEEGKS